MMPKIAEGDANKVWIVPSEIGRALEGLGSTMNSLKGIPDEASPRTRVDMGAPAPAVDDSTLRSTHEEVAAAIRAAEASSEPTRAGTAPSLPTDDAAPSADGPEEPTHP
jgi:hypothetical protein